MDRSGIVYRFGDYTIEPSRHVLRRGAEEITLRPKSFETLLYLVEHAGEPVSKDELLDSVWADSEVTEASVSHCILEVRKALQDDAHRPVYIKTIPRVAYKFVAPVEVTSEWSDILGNHANESEHRPRQLGRRWLVAAVSSGCTLVLLAVVAAWIHFSREPEIPPEVVPLTSYIGLERDPCFSPEGERVAFSWNGEDQNNDDIYVQQIGVGGPARRTDDPATDRNPVWAPDGSQIAFVREVTASKYQVRMVPSTGGVGEYMLAEINANSRLSWSPCGRWLAASDKPKPTESRAIVLISTENGYKLPLTTPPPGMSDLHAAFSPNGRQLVFSRRITLGLAYLYLLDLSEDLEPIGNPKQLTYEIEMSRYPSWTPNGEEVVFGVGQQDSFNLYRISASMGSGPRRLTFAADGRCATISPSGNRLVYERRISERNIYRVAIPKQNGRPGAEALQLERFITSTRPDSSPHFMPDGRIVFKSERSGTTEIWICDSDRTNPRKLTSFGGPLVTTPRGSPDGKWVCFDGMPEGQSDVYVVNSEGGPVTRITTSPFSDTNPSWSHDGQWLYISSNRTGEVQIWKIPVNKATVSGEPVQVTQNGGEDPVESLDGKTLYFSRGSSLWSMDLQGGNEVQVLEGLYSPLSCAIVTEGIYHIPQPNRDGHTAIHFFDFATSKSRQIVSVGDRETNSPLSVSPYGEWLLATLRDYTESDLMLVENFR